jgi:SAM-dependent methyltransferase
MTDQPVTPQDVCGAETLEIMTAAPRYNRWQFERVARFLGRRVLEIGAGIGNISTFIVDGRRECVVLTDTDEYYRNRLRRRFAEHPEVIVEDLTLPTDAAEERFRRYAVDTVVALNVVEHIRDDVGAIRTMGELVQDGGRVVVLVPALPELYGSLDEALGHERRYSPRILTDVFRRAGLTLENVSWFNPVGAVGWWVNSRIRRASRIPVGQLRVFDSMVPILRVGDRVPLPFGQSLIAVGRRHG